MHFFLPAALAIRNVTTRPSLRPVVVALVTIAGMMTLACAPLAARAQQPAKPGCTLTGLPQSERTPQMAAAARSLGNTDPCKIVPGFTAKSLATVWNSLLSSSRTGGRRLETPVPTGTPQGITLAQRQVVIFDFSEVAGEQLKSLRIDVDQKPLLNQQNPGVKVELPVTGFGPDQVFSWTLTTGRGAYRAEFKLIAESDRREVETRLSRLGTESLDPVARLLYTAAIYDDADLFAQRDHVLAEIRRATGI